MSKYEYVVLSGGGINGMAFLGALKALDEKNLLGNIKTFIGTSAGSIMSAFIIAGYSFDEIYAFCLKFNFSKINTDFDINNLLCKYGINTGNRIMYVFNRLLCEKKFKINITLKEFYEKTKKS